MMGKATLRTSIELAAKNEKQAATFYETLAEKFSDNPEIKELFSILAKDEKIHEAQCKALSKKVPADEDEKGNEEDYQFLTAASMSAFFSNEEGAMKDIGKIKTRDDALAKAFAIEKATLFHYQAIKDIIGEDESLNTIISAEKNHLVNVMKYLMTGAKMRDITDKW
jgi:rubrerythrin